jgi:hypothetical protein
MDSTVITAITGVLQIIISLVAKALDGDPDAIAKLRRVDDVLTESPTAKVWADAIARAEGKV